MNEVSNQWIQLLILKNATRVVDIIFEYNVLKILLKIDPQYWLNFLWSCCPFSNSSHSYLKNYKVSILFEQKKNWPYLNLMNIWLIIVSAILSCRCHVWVLCFLHWTIGCTIWQIFWRTLRNQQWSVMKSLDNVITSLELVPQF